MSGERQRSRQPANGPLAVKAAGVFQPAALAQTVMSFQGRCGDAPKSAIYVLEMMVRLPLWAESLA